MMKRYEKYKPSGVEWIGEIPSHWYLKRTKWVFNESKSRNRDLTFADKNLLSVSEYYGVGRRVEKIDSDDILNRAESLSEYKIVELGYLVINIMLAWKKGLGVSAYQGIVSPSYCVFTPSIKNINPKYFHYLYRTDMYAELFRQNSTGIIDSRLRLYPEEFFNTVTILPPLAEQTTIANYLDEKTAQIDTLVANKQKLIDLLKEERIAIINHAVTKGVNPKAKLKPSGIEWLDDIPEHWEVKRLKYVAEKVQTGSTPPSNQEDYYEEQINWFTPSDFSDSLRLTNSKRKISELAITDGVAKLFSANSVLLVGIGATLGKVGYIEEPASSNQQINSIAFNSLEKAKYYSYFLHVNQNNIVSLSNAATLAILNQSQTKNIPYIIPANDKEIEEIIDIIEKMETVFISTISKIEKEIELLQEYRTALISEVVTGKTKVI